MTKDSIMQKTQTTNGAFRMARTFRTLLTSRRAVRHSGFVILWTFMIPLVVGTPAVAADNEYEMENDIVYGKGGDEDLKLDLARPKHGEGPFPGLVLIHGGGWSGGHRAGFRGLAIEAAKRGYVAVTISYRLTQPDPETKLGKVPFPAQLHDCKCAVRWLRANADKYRVDQHRIAVAGGSAGGHLSLLVGLTDASHKLEGNGGHADQSSRVQAVVNIFGPTEMTECWKTSPGAQPFIKGLIGEPDKNADAFQAASPVTYISRDDPPVLTLHGDKDTLVPVSQATLLDEKMKAAGAKHELLILAGAGHGFVGENLKKSNDAMWSFLEKTLKAK
jgi:acetyl esterase/lipase